MKRCQSCVWWPQSSQILFLFLPVCPRPSLPTRACSRALPGYRSLPLCFQFYFLSHTSLESRGDFLDKLEHGLGVKYSSVSLTRLIITSTQRAEPNRGLCRRLRYSDRCLGGVRGGPCSPLGGTLYTCVLGGYVCASVCMRARTQGLWQPMWFRGF